jgi:hypothetical protein
VRLAGIFIAEKQEHIGSREATGVKEEPSPLQANFVSGTARK